MLSGCWDTTPRLRKYSRPDLFPSGFPVPFFCLLHRPIGIVYAASGKKVHANCGWGLPVVQAENREASYAGLRQNPSVDRGKMVPEG